MASSSLGSSKRPCAKVNNAFQQVTCLVDECAIDLSDCRKYYQRHKVCENHSKSSQVSIDGQKLRFCQQCSRFHSLDEFDEGKRSCRKRLDGHNRRRRKARPYLFPTNHGLVSGQSVAQQGQVNPTTGFTNPIWSGVVESPALVDHSIGAFSLLSSAVAPLGRVVHYPSESGSIYMSTSPLDQGLGYDGLGNDCDMGSDAMTDRGNYNHASFDHEDPFYWKS